MNLEAKDWLAPAATVAGFFIVNFAAENYKRFKGGSVLAAALYGELKSYETAYYINANLMKIIQAAHANDDATKVDYKFPRDFEVPKDRVFESTVENAGLLGSALATRVSLIYGLFVGYRVAMKILFARYDEMSVKEVRGHSTVILMWLDKISAAYAEVIPLLEKRSDAWWFADGLFCRLVDFFGFSYPR